MMHIQLATTFDSFRDRVYDVQDKREICKKMISRLLHSHLAAAFDGFLECVLQLKAHRQMVERAMSRWKNPVLPCFFEFWLEFVDYRRAEVSKESQRLAEEELGAEAEKQRDSQQRVIQKEVDRRLDMCRKTIARMMHIQLANAFDSFLQRVESKIERTATCHKVINRMMHGQLAQAFDRLAEATEQLKMQRVVISRTLSKWKTPLLEWGFRAWVGSVLEQKSQDEELAHELAKQQLASQLHEETQRGAEKLKKEADRRLQVCSCAVKRMFHIQLACAFDSFRDRAIECKEKKATCKRMIFRMLHSNLAAAFDGFVQVDILT